MDDAARSTTWKVSVITMAMTLCTSTAGYISSHWGGVTSEQLAAVKNDVAAVAAKQQSSDDVNARNHAETKAQIGTVDAKLDKLSAAVLGKKRKVARDQ